VSPNEHGARLTKHLGRRAFFIVSTAGALVACAAFGTSDDGDPGPPPSPSPDAAVDADGEDAPPDADAAYVPPPLLAYWDFEEESGATVLDRSGAGHNAEIDAPNPDVVRGEGKYGRGVVFARRGNERLVCWATLVELRDNGALSFWMRDDDDEPPTLQNSAGYFSNQNSESNHLFIWRAKTRQPQELEVAFQLAKEDANAPAVYAGTHPFRVEKGVWTRVVVSWTDHDARILIGSGTEPVTVTFDQRWKADQQSCYFGSNAKVAFDEIKFYARALTDDEMAAVP